MRIVWNSHGTRASQAGCFGFRLARKSYYATVHYPGVRMTRHYARPSRKPSRRKVTNWIRGVWSVAKSNLSRLLA